MILEFEKSNYANIEELVNLKKEIINDMADFKEMTDEYFILYYHLLGPWIKRLQKIIFPNNTK